MPEKRSAKREKTIKLSPKDFEVTKSGKLIVNKDAIARVIKSEMSGLAAEDMPGAQTAAIGVGVTIGGKPSKPKVKPKILI